jgi:hypothetical protein
MECSCCVWTGVSQKLSGVAASCRMLAFSCCEHQATFHQGCPLPVAFLGFWNHWTLGSPVAMSSCVVASYTTCRTTKFPRDIPPLPWYRTTGPQMLMAGFLPFSAIYIELYYIFASIWGHKVG